MAGMWRMATALALVALACNAILDNKDAEFSAQAGSCASGYPCGRACVDAGDPAYGCQIGANCQPCPGVSHGTRGCDEQGWCIVAGCDPHFAHCDPAAEGGCETDLDLDPNHCGACDTACEPDATCVNGGCVNGCPPPEVSCGLIGCFDIANDPSHCGPSCSDLAECRAGANATPLCLNGACTVACDDLTGSVCPGLDGGAPYCANLNSDSLNCGGCNLACPSGLQCLAAPRVEGLCCPMNGGQCCFPAGAAEDCLQQDLCCSGVCDGLKNVCQ